MRILILHLILGTMMAETAVEQLLQRLSAAGQEKWRKAGVDAAKVAPQGTELARMFLAPLAPKQTAAVSEATRQQAAELMQRRVKLLGYPAVEMLPGGYEWLKAPKDDQQWPTHLSRHYYLMPLAQMYRATGEERYAAELVEVVRQWVELYPLGAGSLDWTWKNEPGKAGETSGQGAMKGYGDGPWTSLSAEARVHSWLGMLPLVAGSKALDNETTAKLLLSLIGPHRRLMLDFPREGTANQYVALADALIELGESLKDFVGAEECRRVGMERMMRFTEMQIYVDGSVAECSPNYGIGSLRRVIEVMTRLKERGEAAPELFAQRARGALRYYAFTLDPLGRTPRIAKGGGKARAVLTELNRAIGDKEVEWIVSEGKSGSKPKQMQAGYAWAGHYVMRTGWGDKDSWLFFDAGPRGSGHHDKAQLGIQLVAGGETLLVDPGYYTYSTSGEEARMARYLNSTSAHNTVTVDGLGQVSVAGGGRPKANGAAGEYGWQVNERGAEARGTYALGYGDGGWAKAEHQRQVKLALAERVYEVVDEVKSEETHSYEVLWQAPAGAKVEIGRRAVRIEKNGVVARISFESGQPFTITKLAASRDPFAGWYSESYGQLTGATTIRVSLLGKQMRLVSRIETGTGLEIEKGELVANGNLHWEFAELPVTLRTMGTGETTVAQMNVNLPGNYSKEGKYPLFVYLIGGNGGKGENLDHCRSAIGPEDYICVGMPLFKTKVDPEEMSRGLMIAIDDVEVLRRSLRVMLEALYQRIPNVDVERSVFGGHSNGAHATGVLLAAQDEYLLGHFGAFFLHEGGVGPLLANVLQKRSMAKPRFLVMMGDKTPWSGEKAPSPTAVLEWMTGRLKQKFTFVTMKGYGHEQPAEYLRVIGQWARGEKLREIPVHRD